MATWHQIQARKRGGYVLYHETLWTVVTTSKETGMDGLSRFKEQKEAETYLENVLKHGKCTGYILKPFPGKEI